MVKEGATVLDVGMNRTPDGVKGDVHFESVEP
jgi:5,10-methylene-tetrahydrofolate dehydrogenase/methenyl tetrahydrofolate cyclohydrolase